jgi:hypothetical protein
MSVHRAAPSAPRSAIRNSPPRPNTIGRDANRGRQGLAGQQRATEPRLNRSQATRPGLADHGTAGRGPAGRNFVAAPRVRGGANNTGRLALSNPGFARASGPESRTLSHATFHGYFANAGPRLWNRGWYWRRHHPVVMGWAGPLFWPYAYDDFVDYTYYPYAYDTFWPYAYDDVYVGIFGPYAYGSAAYASAGPTGGRRISTSRSASLAGQSEICTVAPTQLTDWPIEQISDVVQPTDDQRAALDGLQSAAAKAMDVLRSACPYDLPSTPTG